MTSTSATEVLNDLRAAMESAASGNTMAATPVVTEAAARARTELVHRVQRAAFGPGGCPETAERLLALTALLDCVLHRVEDIDRGVTLLDPAVAGAARRLLIDAG